MCLLIGAKLANITLPENQNQLPLNSNNQDEQIQILVFVVGDLTQKNPVLTSAWSLIMYYQDSKGVMFVPLVNEKQDDYIDYKRSFTLTSENEPLNKTIKFFNTRFKTKWGYYLVLDNFSANYLFNWMVDNTSGVTYETQPEESDMVDSVCQKISHNQLKALDSIDWNSLLPAHFVSNLTLEDLNNYWQILLDSNQLLCDRIVFD